ncbi:MAG: dockerin type I repeat-containing protein [Ruminococcus sp.]|nr:dockerin type I repeat-containing protein [Ruminococcus sp.]
MKDTGGTEDEPRTFGSTYTAAVNGADKDSYLDKGIRCIVNCSNNSKTSDIVSFRYFDSDHYILGDVDGDKAVTSIDTTFIQRDIVRMKLPAYYDRVAADVDGNSSVSAYDVTWIQRDLVNMSTPYAIGDVFKRPD